MTATDESRVFCEGLWGARCQQVRVRTRLLTLHNSRTWSTEQRRGSDAAGGPPLPAVPLSPPSSRAYRHPAPPAPRASYRAPPVASQLPRASVAYSMRLSYPSTIIWIYCTSALLPTSSSRICGFAKSSTNINGLYCKVHRETISFVRSALEFVCLAVAPTCTAHGSVMIWCWWEWIMSVNTYVYLCYCKASVNIVLIHVIIAGFPWCVVETRTCDMAHSWRPRTLRRVFAFQRYRKDSPRFTFDDHPSTPIIM